MIAHLPTLLAETLRSELRWDALPPAWVVVLVVLPLAVLVGWWGYRRESDLSPRRRALLAGLRAAALLFFALVLCGPYMELSDLRRVRSHLVVLLDTSDSMSTEDAYEPEDARALAKATGLGEDAVAHTQRLDLARAVLTNRANGLLERWTEDFRVHVLTFGSQLTPLVKTGDDVDEAGGADATAGDGGAALTPADSVRAALGGVRAGEPSTRIGQALATLLDTFRLRDEPVAGVIVVSDGQNNGGVPPPLAAGRRAGTAKVPVFAVGTGDPRSPRNVHVSNLRASEVVLARDAVQFQFSVRAKGFEGRPARIEMRLVDADGAPTGAPRLVTPDSIVLEGGDAEQEVRVTHVFESAGTYTLRIGVPPQPEERIEVDNWVTHTIRVIDRKIKVLYVDGPPRWEYLYLSNALTRDIDTMLAHTLLLGGDPATPQRATHAPGWQPLSAAERMPSRDKLFEYDVVILGDVAPDELGRTTALSEQALQDLHEFVEKGGGLMMIAGGLANPSMYRDTPLAGLLPVVVDRTAEALDPELDSSVGFEFRLTPEGLASPLMDVTGDPGRSKQLWENAESWRQYWSYPALRAKTLARVLAVSGDARHTNKFGPRPLIALMLYGRGRVLYIGVDSLWYMRKEAQDRYFYRFYGEAVRNLATYKLLGGNKRFKIATDRDEYALYDPVRVTLDVLDRDFNPSTDAEQTVQLDMPGEQPGTREVVDLTVPAAAQHEPGVYRRTIAPARPGQYRISAQPEGDDDERPEKVFTVTRSSLEGRELLLDEKTLRDMADASSGGRYMNLWELPELAPAKRTTPVPTDPRPDPLWDTGWTLAIALGLLAAEWLLRKRFQLV